MQVKSVTECSATFVFFRPSLSYHFPLRHCFVYFKCPLKTGFTVCVFLLSILYVHLLYDLGLCVNVSSFVIKYEDMFGCFDSLVLVCLRVV